MELDLYEVTAEYKRRFGSLPNLMGFSPTAYAKIPEVLALAIVNGKKLSKEEYYRQLGVNPPPDDKNFII